MVDETAVDQALAARHRDVEVLADEFRSRGIATTVHIQCGDPTDVILKTAESVGADLVVVGNRGLTGPRRLLGSVPTHVARASAAPVLIVRSG